MRPRLLSLLLVLCGALSAAEGRAQEVVITYDGVLEEFARYQDGDDYVVEIPVTHRSRLIRGGTSACANRDGATVWTFPNPIGTQAVLRHAAGRIEITFGAAAPAPLPSATRDDVPALLVADLPIIAEGPGEKMILGEPRELTAGTLADQSISLANFSLDVPDSPAFAVLGVTPETVVRPSNPQELITSMVNGLDRHGHFQTGLALDTAPYLLFFGEDVTLGRYQESYLTRFFTRAQVSFATTKGTQTEDLSTRLAMGFHFTLLDRGDPRFDLDLHGTYDAIDEQVRQARGPIRPGQGMQEEAARREDEMRPLFKAAFAEARRRNWNRTNWSLGAAPSWISLGGGSGDFQYNGATAWTSFAYGFEGVPALEDKSQLILHARYRNHEEVPDLQKAGAFKRQDSLAAGARLRIGSVDTNFSFDGAYVREWGDREETGAYRVSLGLERRMTNNLWVSLSFGKEFGREGGEDPLLILGTFKLGYGEKPAPLAPSSSPIVLRQPERRTAVPVEIPPDEPAVVMASELSRATPARASGATSLTTAKVDRPKAPVGQREAALPGERPRASGIAKSPRPATPGGAREATLPGTPTTGKIKRPSTPGGARAATLPPEPSTTKKTPRPVFPAGVREATLPP